MDAIPGVNHRGAAIIQAEVGIDMSRFPSAGHLASWAGICPGNERSAGKLPFLASSTEGSGNGWGRKKRLWLLHTVF